MLHKILFSIARNVTDIDVIEVDRLELRAEKQLNAYEVTDKGFKGFYAKQNQGWILQLILIFLSPFITAKLLATKNKYMNPESNLDFDDDTDFDDDDDEYTEAMRIVRKHQRN